MKKSIRALGLLAALVAGAFASIGIAVAQEQDILPAAITFATSTGYWEDSKDTTTASTPAGTEKALPRHGYYKVFAVRQADRTSKIYLQQIAVDDDGLTIVSTSELRELSELKPYVTDIRPENPDGFIKEPGLFATVVLKTDPDGETERWRIAMDDLGEVTIDKPSE